MNDKDKAALLTQFDNADASTQNKIAAKIQNYCVSNEFHVANALAVDDEGNRNASMWASVYQGAQTLHRSAEYLDALAWFYLDTRPTNVMTRLVNAKLALLGRGKETDEFWKFLGELA